MHNSYHLINADGVAQIDLQASRAYHRGIDYYIDVLRALEARGNVRGLTFFIAATSPETLPRTGDDVVLLLHQDEAYNFAPYWPDLRGVIRTYPADPPYRDGVPSTPLKALSLIHSAYKTTHAQAGRVRASLARRDVAAFRMQDRIAHTPLGTFFRFHPAYRAMAERSADFAFLGSVQYAPENWRFAHRLLAPPKLRSRALMLEQLDVFRRQTGRTGEVTTTGDFWESVSENNFERYARALENCRISLCPRGAALETYRFFESCVAGCVCVCEALPDAWFYQGSPAMMVRDWSDLPSILGALLSDPEALQRRSEATLAYWKARLSDGAVAAYIETFLLHRSRRIADRVHAAYPGV